MDDAEFNLISKKDALSAGLKRYFTGKQCKNGHLDYRLVSTGICVSCNAEKSRRYRKKNPEKVSLRLKDNYERKKDERRKSNAIRYQANKEKIKSNARENYRKTSEEKRRQKRHYYIKNKEKIKIATKEWRKKNIERSRAYHREYAKRYSIKNIEKITARRVITSILRRSGMALSRRDYKLGYESKDLRKRIEFQFKDGMSWENYGEWHIDHKKPISRFIEQGITDLSKINMLCNLQPLWARDNIIKSNKF